MNRSFENCILCQQCGSKIPSYEERHDLEDGFESDGGACCYAGRKREEQVRREAQKNRDALDARIDRLQRLSTEALKGLNDGAAMMFEALIAAEENSDPDASPPDWFKERWSGEDPVPSTMALGAGCSLGISLAVSSALTGVPSPRTQMRSFDLQSVLGLALLCLVFQVPRLRLNSSWKLFHKLLLWMSCLNATWMLFHKLLLWMS